MTRRSTGGFQPKIVGGAPPVCPVIPPEGIPIRTAAVGAANPLRSLGATYARQALADIRKKSSAWMDKHALDGDIELRPGVFKHAANEGHRPDYYRCMDCRIPDPELFMVEDDVWEAAGLTKGIICVPCFETRLGRKLAIQDFKAVPMNNSIFLGYLMGIIQ